MSSLPALSPRTSALTVSTGSPVPKPPGSRDSRMGSSTLLSPRSAPDDTLVSSLTELASQLRAASDVSDSEFIQVSKQQLMLWASNAESCLASARAVSASSPLTSNPDANLDKSGALRKSVSVAETMRGGRTTTRRPAPPPQQEAPGASFGTCISASMYFVLESIMARTFSDRAVLYMKSSSGSELVHCGSAGQGLAQFKKASPNPTGLVKAVHSTGIAANLNVVNMEDVADCQGPTKSKNALFFPVKSAKNGAETVGVICLVNKKRGTEDYDATDETTVHMLTPSIAYLYDRYAHNVSQSTFDPAPLHRLIPPPVWSTPTVGLPSDFEVPFVQKVYHRDGPEKFIRKELLADEGVDMEVGGVADNLRSVEDYIAMVEQCWKASIVSGLEAERQLRQKQSHISDAREILNRKQKKLVLLKDALCEQITKNEQHQLQAQAAKRERSRSFRKRV